MDAQDEAWKPPDPMQDNFVEPDTMQDGTAIIDRKELPPSSIKIGRLLGSGGFADVFQGTLAIPGGKSMMVAVKKVKPKSKDWEHADFLAEISLVNSVLPHKHIIKFIGHVLKSKPEMLVMEYCSNGNLRDYLIKCRASSSKPQTVTPDELLGFSIQIAEGMSWLERNKIVHRDLAARNVLVTAQRRLKIGDFGLAKDAYEDGKHEAKAGGRLPFKWMAPECFHDAIFSSASDVWAFGITVWEIMTLGRNPYPSISANDVLFNKLEMGYRMDFPDNTPLSVPEIAGKCWAFFPEDRPTFEQLFQLLVNGDESGYLAPGSGYIDIKQEEEPEYAQATGSAQPVETIETIEIDDETQPVYDNRTSDPDKVVLVDGEEMDEIQFSDESETDTQGYPVYDLAARGFEEEGDNGSVHVYDVAGTAKQ